MLLDVLNWWLEMCERSLHVTISISHTQGHFMSMK
jgi:hypothetical protein